MDERTRSNEAVATQVDPKLPSEKPIKIDAKVLGPGRYVAFQFAELAIARDPFVGTSCG